MKINWNEVSLFRKTAPQIHLSDSSNSGLSERQCGIALVTLNVLRHRTKPVNSRSSCRLDPVVVSLYRYRRIRFHLGPPRRGGVRGSERGVRGKVM